MYGLSQHLQRLVPEVRGRSIMGCGCAYLSGCVVSLDVHILGTRSVDVSSWVNDGSLE